MDHDLPMPESGTDVDNLVTGISTGRTFTTTFPRDQEYAGRMIGVKRFEVYREMGMSDGGIRAVEKAYKLPITQADWSIKGERDDLVAFVEPMIMDGWQGFLGRALYYLRYGSFVFEQVFEVEGGRTIEKGIYPRPPWTWDQPRYDNVGNLESITQRYNGNYGDVPMDRAVFFVNEGESESVLGDSIHRSSWKHWDIANHLERVDSIGHERHAIGIPYAELATTDQDVFDAIDASLRDMYAHQDARLVVKPGIVEKFQMIFNDYNNSALLSTLEYHRRMIYVSSLTQFLSLGSGGAGSYALSKSLTEIFLLGVNAVARHVAEVVNEQRIKRIIDLNFSNVAPEDYPKAVYSNLDRVSVEEAAALFTGMGDNLTWTADLENWARQAVGAPVLTDEEADEAKTQRAGATATIELSDADLDRAYRLTQASLHGQADAISLSDRTCCDDTQQSITQLADGARSDYPKGPFWRDFTDTERHVRLEDIAADMDTRDVDARERIEAVKRRQVSQLGARLREVLGNQRDDFAGVRGMRPAQFGAYQAAITEGAQEAYDEAGLEVRQELTRMENGTTVDKIVDEPQLSLADEATLNSTFANQLRGQHEQLIEANAQELAEMMSTKTAAAFRAGATAMMASPGYLAGSLSIEDVIAAAESAATLAGGAELANAASFAASTPLQLGRMLATQAYIDSGEAEYVVYSAEMDGATCGPCFEADGASTLNGGTVPPAPNPECAGTSYRCRCAYIAVPPVTAGSTALPEAPF